MIEFYMVDGLNKQKLLPESEQWNDFVNIWSFLIRCPIKRYYYASRNFKLLIFQIGEGKGKIPLYG